MHLTELDVTSFVPHMCNYIKKRFTKKNYNCWFSQNVQHPHFCPQPKTNPRFYQFARVYTVHIRENCITNILREL